MCLCRGLSPCSFPGPGEADDEGQMAARRAVQPDTVLHCTVQINIVFLHVRRLPLVSIVFVDYVGPCRTGVCCASCDFLQVANRDTMINNLLAELERIALLLPSIRDDHVVDHVCTRCGEVLLE